MPGYALVAGAEPNLKRSLSLHIQSAFSDILGSDFGRGVLRIVRV